MKFLHTVLCLWLGLTAASTRAAEAPPVAVRIASGGQAQQPVVVSEAASPRVQKAASTLAHYLQRITGAPFEIRTGDGTAGIAVGLAADFQRLPSPEAWRAPRATQRENYLLRSHPNGLYLLGATDLAVEHAVWDLLYRLGYRQFFPGQRWEVVPAAGELSIAVSAIEAPDYLARRIWYGFGPWDYASEPYAAWCARNRVTSGVVLNSGHAYGAIAAAKRAEFARHPEFFALVGEKRQPPGEGSKFCIGNPALRELVVEYAMEYFHRDPEADSISMDPSDGGGWCQCDKCAALGSVTDRALTLANQVAEAVNRRWPGKLVGMYAYNYHSPPPSIGVHPNVVISVATSFLRGGLTLDEIIQGWSSKGAALGIREYYSVNTWDRDMPGRARGSDLAYLARTIPEFHARGARYLSAESSDNWGPNGLGYYVAARILWDVREAERLPQIVDDFLARAFGPAKGPMGEFYQQLDGSRDHPVLDDQLGRMYRHLAAARQLANTPEIRARVEDLLLYTRYADLYDRYAQAQGDRRQAAFEALIRHAYRMRTTMLVHAKALYRDLDARDKTVSIPPQARIEVPEGRNPWKSSHPFAEEELEGFLAEGIAGRPLAKIDFELARFSGDLVPAGPLRLPAVRPGETGAGRGQQTFFTWVDRAPGTIELRVTGGLIAHYRDRGNVRIALWKVGGVGTSGERETKVAEDRSVPPDGAEHVVRLAAQEPGLHKITLSDGNDMTRAAWPPGTPFTFRSSMDEPINQSGRWSLYFYVPRGTQVIGLLGGGSGRIVDPAGKPALRLEGRKPGYHSLAVPPGLDGKLWKIEQASGAVRLLTVPPCLARSGDELLLPSEVVRRDGM